MSVALQLVTEVDFSDENRPVVMVDDEEIDFMSLSRYYKRSKLTNPLLHFNSGIVFLEHLKSVKRGENALPALVLMDVNMPQMSGFEVVEKMREDEAFRDIPVVAMLTSSTDTNDMNHAQSVGVNNYLVKPYKGNEYQVFFDSLVD